MGSVRLRLDVSYDGADFSGWAVQPARRTVAGVLLAELSRLFGAGGPIGLTVAGRTDAGVHASAQVVHFDARVTRDDSSWVRGTNTCRIAIHRPMGGDTLVVLAVEDNLVKGAAGQAVQNMNLMFGFPETTAIDQVALLP